MKAWLLTASLFCSLVVTGVLYAVGVSGLFCAAVPFVAMPAFWWYFARRANQKGML